jgi:hypothetical protein
MDVTGTQVFGQGVYNNATSGDYASIPTYLPSYGQGTFMSVAAWITTESLASTIRQIFTNDRYLFPTTVRVWQFRTDASKQASFIVWNQAGSLAKATGATALDTVGREVLVVGTWDGATVSVYVNGVLDGSAVLAGTAVYATTYPPNIGYRLANTDYDPFAGTIGPVLWWRRALSADEVWQLWAPETRWSLFAQPQVRLGMAAAPPPATGRSFAVMIGG